MNDKKTINILLVEDEEGHADLIRRAFESSKSGLFNLNVAKTIREARKILAENTPDLAIIDYELPDGEGIELLPHDTEEPSSPIIIMTGHGDEKVAVASLKAGALDYFVKSEETFKDIPHIAERALREWENICKRKQAETQQRLTQFAVDHSSDPVYWVRADGAIAYANAAACQSLGYTRDEITSLSVPQIDPDFPADAWPAHWQEMKEDGSMSFEAHHSTKAGQVFPVEIRTDFLVYEGQEYIWAHVRDITKRKQIEEALIESEKKSKESKEKYEDLYNNAPVPYFSVGIDGIIKRCNHKAEEMSEYSKKELIGMNTIDLYVDAPDGKEKAMKLMRQFKSGQPIFKEELLMKKKKGEPFWINLTVNSIKDKDGNVIESRSVAEDINERKRTEDKLNQKTELMRLLHHIALAANESSTAEETMQICLDMICSFVGWPVGHIYLTDSNGRLISSKIWCIANKERFKDFRKISEATSFDIGVGLPGRVLESGKPVWITDVTKDSNFPRAKLAKDINVKAGFAFPVLEGKKVVAVLEFFSKESIEPDKSFLEALSNLAFQIGRVTERKRAEDELHRLGKAIEQSAEDIMITDIDGNIQYINPAFEKITGYKKKEIIGQNPRILQSGKQDKLFYKKMWDTLKQGKVWSGHFINKKKDGTLFEEDATISPVFDNSDNMINYVALKRDVTKEVMLESQLRQSQKLEAVGTLAGGIAHDFNNILTGIIGYTELSIDRLPEDSEISDYLSQVRKSSYRARDLVKQILTFSRQIEKELKPLELGFVIKEVLKLIKASLPSTIKICSNIDKKTGILVADLTQMHQLIMNLCVNAEYAMREKGGILEINLDSVNVDADLASIHTNLKEGPFIKLTVRDTGNGMDKKIAERVFDPFFTTKKVGEGTGMGLTIVHGIVLSHGGAIAINSEPGKGTTFEVYLPKAGADMGKENLQTQPIPRGSERILLVDDEKTVLNVEQKILENLGYEVVAKGNSLEVLETFKADPKGFDIVITDQTMPDMTGDVLAGELMRIQRDIPVILCTGFSHLITKEKVKTIGIRKLIMKPFNVRDMAIAIREALEKEK